MTGFGSVAGRGVQARSDGRTLHVGGPRLLESLKLNCRLRLAEFERAASAKGQSVVHLVVDQRPVASLALADVIRPESHEAVKRLHAKGAGGGHAHR